MGVIQRALDIISGIFWAVWLLAAVVEILSVVLLIFFGTYVDKWGGGAWLLVAIVGSCGIVLLPFLGTTPVVVKNPSSIGDEVGRAVADALRRERTAQRRGEK